MVLARLQRAHHQKIGLDSAVSIPGVLFPYPDHLSLWCRGKDRVNAFVDHMDLFGRGMIGLDQVVRRYAPEKVVTAHLDLGPNDPLPALDGDVPGRVIESTRDRIRVAVPRERVTLAAQLLLAKLPVADLTIEESDIGDVVERIFREKSAPPP